jgi:2-polyprenyl-3-methyl-5-hydroxy-6-metoxy-1,4-benzoquinol methylase
MDRESEDWVLRQSCPACGSTRYGELYSCGFSEPPIITYLQNSYGLQTEVKADFLNKAQFILNECQACGLIFQGQILGDHLMKALYEGWTAPNPVPILEGEKKTIPYYMRLAGQIELILAYFNRQPDKIKVCDFGMGWGEWCMMAKGYGCSTYGAELSQAKITHAQNSGITVVPWDELPLHQFDFINMEQVCEHIPEPLATVTYLSRALAPGGLIRISVPSARRIKEKLKVLDWTAPKGSQNSLNAVAPLEHINCFAQNSLQKMGHLAGLVPVKIHSGLWKSRMLSYLSAREILKPFYHQFVPRQRGPLSLYFKKAKDISNARS